MRKEIDNKNVYLRNEFGDIKIGMGRNIHEFIKSEYRLEIEMNNDKRWWEFWKPQKTVVDIHVPKNLTKFHENKIVLIGILRFLKNDKATIKSLPKSLLNLYMEESL